MLHQSLLDLAEQAPRCQDVATARGVLAESQELLRNAVAHRSDPVELTRWYSALLTHTLHSPAVTKLAGPVVAQIVLTGAIGRGDGLPTSQIEWLTVTTDSAAGGSAADREVAELLNSVGLTPAPHDGELAPTDRAGWLTRITAAAGSDDAALIGTFDDAGSWLREQLLNQLGSAVPLLVEAVDHRPPALRSAHGLPDRDAAVDIHRDLLVPIAAIARWAGLTGATRTLATPERITLTTRSGILSEDEAAALQQGWITGLDLQLQRWVDRVIGRETTAADLTALQRSSYGAASRGVAGAIRSLAARHDIALS